jgi:hypothetical protein
VNLPIAIFHSDFTNPALPVPCQLRKSTRLIGHYFAKNSKFLRIYSGTPIAECGVGKT